MNSRDKTFPIVYKLIEMLYWVSPDYDSCGIVTSQLILMLLIWFVPLRQPLSLSYCYTCPNVYYVRIVQLRLVVWKYVIDPSWPHFQRVLHDLAGQVIDRAVDEFTISTGCSCLSSPCIQSRWPRPQIHKYEKYAPFILISVVIYHGWYTWATVSYHSRWLIRNMWLENLSNIC